MAAMSKKKNSQLIAPAKRKWLKAIDLVKDHGDPWEKYHIEKMNSEKGKRHR
jgi:hypothetical protein